ncbi:Quinate repressor protein [Cyphellophora attinorum]|uniref:Quinate repressor protein n=1 Tax=Cyphellophora attinorum TaxID=1664694 RepID=A0A0N0NIL9_9EURO|nr:Quinate repressor protein [Phialophora attinorum]KPI35599.1 Quinate repressor protein [Phialophora attinorum]
MKRKLIFQDEPDIDQPSSGWSSDANVGEVRKGRHTPWTRQYQQNASILFFGPRATGKSSIAVIAGALLGWKVVDCDHEFVTQTGATKQQYRAEHGTEQYRAKKLDLVQHLLGRDPERCVFVCGTVAPREEKDFLATYASQHPVVYVVREQALVRQCLGLPEDSPLESALEQIHRYFRQHSNFEFFNIDERQEPAWQSVLSRFLHEKSLDDFSASRPRVLRKTRRHIAKLLHNIYGPAFEITQHGDSHISETSPEFKEGSFVLLLDLNNIRAEPGSLDLVDTDIDAVQLNVEATPENWKLLLTTDTLAWTVSLLRRKFDVPVMISICCPSASKNLSASELRHYRQLLLHALRPAPEFLALDLSLGDDVVRDIVRSRGYTKVVGSLQHWQDDEETVGAKDLVKAYRRASELGCELVVLRGSSRSDCDSFKCQEVYKSIAQIDLSTPAVVIDQGSHGRLSQVLNRTMTPVVAHPQERMLALTNSASAGLTTAQQLRIIRKMLVPEIRSRFYVFGAEVRESLSPAMHNAAFTACGLPYTYEVRETGDLSVLQRVVNEPSFGGASISLPFKSLVLPLASRHSPAVELIGAANTLLPYSEQRGKPQQREGESFGEAAPELVAENTDWMGIHTCIAKHTTPANHITENTSAIVIGAGGIARATIYALMKLGVGHICILNRTMANAIRVKEHFETVCSDLDDTLSELSADSEASASVPRFHVLNGWDAPWLTDVPHPSIVVCAIPVFDTEASTEYPPEIRHDWFENRTGGLIADLSWKRRKTKLGAQLSSGKPRGWKCIDPIEVLYEQGAQQFPFFAKCKAPRRAMLEAFLKQYKITYENT